MKKTYPHRQIFNGKLRGCLESNGKTSLCKLLLKWHFSDVFGFDVDRKGKRGMWPSKKLKNQSNSFALHITIYLYLRRVSRKKGGVADWGPLPLFNKFEEQFLEFCAGGGSKDVSQPFPLVICVDRHMTHTLIY